MNYQNKIFKASTSTIPANHLKSLFVSVFVSLHVYISVQIPTSKNHSEVSITLAQQRCAVKKHVIDMLLYTALPSLEQKSLAIVGPHSVQSRISNSVFIRNFRVRKSEDLHIKMLQQFNKMRIVFNN